MSDLHDLCKFPQRPISEEYIANLNHYLRNGIPATYTVEEAYNYINGIEDVEPLTTTTPLHLICTHVPLDLSEDEQNIVNQFVDILFEYGAGWSFTDVNNETPGCILIRRGLKQLPLYQKIVDAGVRAELVLRKVTEFDMEVIEDTDGVKHEEFGELKYNNSNNNGSSNNIDSSTSDCVCEKNDAKNEEPIIKVEQQKGGDFLADSIKKEFETNGNEDEKAVDDVHGKPSIEVDDDINAPSQNQVSYLDTKLEYTEDALVTKDRRDGVMMAWESDIMQLGADALFSGVDNEKREEGSGKVQDSEVTVLNIGFGMGIIDRMIQSKKPTKHYICEAHPDVLNKMKKDGWFDKANVVVLPGRWQDELDKLLSLGNTFFDGIYYDTFSEHYLDMLELFDYVVGLLKPNGVFSFFNGLGADREVIYEVYKKLVSIDLENYGLQCEFQKFPVPKDLFMNNEDKSIWDDVKRSYWSCPTYYHPVAKFMDF